MYKALKFGVISLMVLASCIVAFPEKAHAQQNWTLLVTSPDYAIKACKESIGSIYGPLWEVTVVIARHNPPGTNLRVLGSSSAVLRNGNEVYTSPYYNAWYGNTVQAYTVLSSQLHNESLKVTLHMDEMGNPLLVMGIYERDISAINVC